MTILVAGATGRVGHHGAEIVEGDLTNPESLDGALKGVTGPYLISMGGDDYAPLRTTPEIMDRAVDASVRRVTVLTGTDDELAVLDAVRAAGVGWTHLRPLEFMSNKLDWAASIRSEGVVRALFADRPFAIVHEADAAVVAAALLSDDHAGQTYVPSGPATVTAREAAGIMDNVLQQTIRLIELSADDARRGMLDSGITEDVADYVLSYLADPPPEASTVLPTVENVTGRPPRTFAQWVSEHADAFRSDSRNG